MKIDRDWVSKHRTERGGWNYEMLRLLGVPCDPDPKKGWLSNFQPIELSDEEIDTYHQMRFLQKRSDRKKFLRNGEPPECCPTCGRPLP